MQGGQQSYRQPASNSMLPVQTYEGPHIDVDTVIGILMAEDLSPLALTTRKADTLGFTVKAPPPKKPFKSGKLLYILPCRCMASVQRYCDCQAPRSQDEWSQGRSHLWYS